MVCQLLCTFIYTTETGSSHLSNASLSEAGLGKDTNTFCLFVTGRGCAVHPGTFNSVPSILAL